VGPEIMSLVFHVDVVGGKRLRGISRYSGA